MRPTDRFENWFITSLQTGINDTTSSFRLNDNLNVSQARLVIDPYDESIREVVKVTSVDGNLVYVERGDDNTAPQYHLEGAVVALNVVAGDMNDLYADWDDTKTTVLDAVDDANDATNAANQAASDASSAASDASNAASAATTATGLANTATSNANAATSAANSAAGSANSAASNANTAASNAQDAADNAQGIVDDVAGAVASNIQPIQINGAKTAVGIGKAPTDGALDVDGDIYSNGKKVLVSDDTGWKSITPTSGYTSTAEARVKNGVLYLRGQITKNSGTLVSGQIATLHADTRPDHSYNFVGAGAVDRSHKWGIYSNGEVRINGAYSGSGSSHYVILDGASVVL